MTADEIVTAAVVAAALMWLAARLSTPRRGGVARWGDVAGLLDVDGFDSQKVAVWT